MFLVENSEVSHFSPRHPMFLAFVVCLIITFPFTDFQKEVFKIGKRINIPAVCGRPQIPNLSPGVSKASVICSHIIFKLTYYCETVKES